MYKIVFFDIDGTLLTTSREIPESTRQAICELRAAGIGIAIASGRTPFNIAWIVETLGIDTYVVYNGGLVIHRGQVLHQAVIEETTVQQLMDLVLAQGHSVVLNHLNTFSLHGSRSNEIRSQYLRHWSLEREHGEADGLQSVFQIELFCADEQISTYRTAFPDLTFYPWMSKRNAFNVVPRDVSKAGGIDALLSHLHVSPAEAVAFGDGPNDFEMLSHVGMGVAMGNASAELQRASDFVTRSVDEHGISYGLRALNLIR